MKKHTFLIVYLLIAVCELQAQNLPSFSLTQEVECNGQTLIQPEFWRAYQTLNNEWDGPIDSTSCVKWLTEGLELTNADTSRPVFIRMVDTAPILLESDFLYGVDLCMDWSSDQWGIDLEDESFCNNGFCHGTMVRVSIPPAPLDTVDVAFRTHFAAFQYEEVFGDLFELCFATEAFEVQHLEDVVFKFIPEGTMIEFYCVYLSNEWDQMSMTVDQEDISNFQSGPSEYSFDAWPWGLSSFMFRYQGEGYPSDTTISYIEFTPEPNVETPQMVTVTFNEYCTYTLQPFTQLRAGHVVDNDSVFHNLQLINLTHQLCVLLYVELVFDPDDRFVHAGGPIDFQGNTSCMRFHKGSTLEVASGHKLLYGPRGDGMLALYGGAEIVVQENARMEINNSVMLFEHPWQQPVRPVDVHLKAGSELVFGAKSKLHNESSDHAVKLRVYLEGGVVDLSGLSPEERSHVELVFPSGTTTIRLHGNPVSDQLKVWWSMPEDGEVELCFFDPQGRLHDTQNVTFQRGQYLSCDVRHLPVGDYVVVVRQGEYQETVRILKQ